MPRRVFITVAEVSGDQHAAQLIHGLRQLDPAIQVEGLGGPLMRQAGAVIHHQTTDRAAMSWRAALRVMEVAGLLSWTRRHFDARHPDLLVCIDSFAMNVHFARLAHQRGVPVLYYIPPQLWASREGRLKQLKRWVDRVACILPFEEAYLRRHGVAATFVGHPLFDELPPRQANNGPRFPDRQPVVGLIPGSRRSEVIHNFPHLLDVARRIRAAFPTVSFLVPTLPATHAIVEQVLLDWRSADGVDLRPAIRHQLDGFDALVPQCDLCLTKNGTSTLHVASHGVPMIVVYRGNRVLWHAVGRWIVKTRTFALVNLLSDSPRHIVPEFIPWYGSNAPVADRAIDFLRHPDQLDQQRQRLRELVDRLDHPGASMNVARLAMEMMTARDCARHPSPT